MTQPQKPFTFMDWISQNFIDFTPKRFGMTIEVSWGFVVAFGITMCFLIYLRLKRRRRIEG